MGKHKPSTAPRTCVKCETVGTADAWPRYAKNGRLSKYCHVCEAAYAEATRKGVEARKRGYRGHFNTPEYKAQQRIRKAEKQGRVLVPIETKRLIARLKLVDKGIADDCAKAYRQFKSKFKLSDKERYRRDPEIREKCRAKTQARYWKNVESERLRVQVYKHANPGRVEAWQGKRGQREAARADGSLSNEIIRALFGSAKSCPYCGSTFSRSMPKALDHIVPLSSNGWHSKANVLICCRSCNAKKHARQFEEWVGMLNEPYRTRCEKMYRQRFGCDPAQSLIGLEYCGQANSGS